MRAKILAVAALSVVGINAQAQQKKTATNNDMSKRYEVTMDKPANYEWVPGHFGVSQGMELDEKFSYQRPTKMIFKNKESNQDLYFFLSDTNKNGILDVKDKLVENKVFLMPMHDTSRYTVFILEKNKKLKKFACSAQEYEALSQEEQEKAIKEKAVPAKLKDYKDAVVETYCVDPFGLTQLVVAQEQPKHIKYKSAAYIKL